MPNLSTRALHVVKVVGVTAFSRRSFTASASTLAFRATCRSLNHLAAVYERSTVHCMVGCISRVYYPPVPKKQMKECNKTGQHRAFNGGSDYALPKRDSGNVESLLLHLTVHAWISSPRGCCLSSKHFTSYCGGPSRSSEQHGRKHEMASHKKQNAQARITPEASTITTVV